MPALGETCVIHELNAVNNSTSYLFGREGMQE